MQSLGPDLSVLIDDTKLNLRVVVLINTPNGYIFEESTEGYLFALGGRIKLHESTPEACVREIFEEIKLKEIPVVMAGIVENFFSAGGDKKVHEINFVFKANLEKELAVENLISDDGNIGYVCVKPDDFEKHDIRPKPLVQIATTDKPFLHIVNRE